MGKRPRGRPKIKPEAGKRYSLNMRTTKEIREKLEAAAKESGLSIAQEVERRLQRTFERDEEVYGFPHNQVLLKLFASVIADAEARTRKKWTEDKNTRHQVLMGVAALIGEGGAFHLEDIVRYNKHEIGVHSATASLTYAGLPSSVIDRVKDIIEEED